MIRDWPQLRMIHRLGAFPPARELPYAYHLRLAGPGDSADIAVVLTKAFVEPWDAARVESELLCNADVPKTFVIETEAGIVAVASYQLKPVEFPESGWLHWVGADPGHAGRALGYGVSRAVLSEVVGQGHASARLTTDDGRLAAIKTYLRLGFEPEPCHGTHQARWAAVLRQLESGPSR